MAGSAASGRRVETRPTTGIITSFSARGSRGERVVVWLDGKRAFDISAVVAGEMGLQQGEMLDDARVEKLLRDDEPYRARDYALRLLARRDFLGNVLMSKLTAVGISPGETERVLGWLRERGYVDDLRYAMTYMSDRTKAGWGRRRITAELARKGLDHAVASEAWHLWNEQHGETENEDVLLALVKRRFGKRLGSDPETTRRRASAFLARRGHDWDLIARVLKAVEEDTGSTADHY